MHVKVTEINTEYTIREPSFRFLNMKAIQERPKAQRSVTTISSGTADQSSLEFPRSQQYFQETVISQGERKRGTKEQCN